MASQNAPPIYTAAKNGDCRLLQQQIDNGVSVNTTGLSGWTPLHAATYYGKLRAVKILLRHGASVEAEIPKDGYRPLHKACERNYVEVVRQLIDHGADREAKAHSNLTPLHTAAGEGRTEIVVYLLGLGVQIDPLSVSGESPLHRAARKGSKEVVSLLIEAGATVDMENSATFTPLLVAAITGHADTVQSLLDHRADSKYKNEHGWTALHYACYHGRAAVLRVLLQKSPDLEDETYSYGYRPLHCAAEKGHVEIIRILLDAGADLNAATIDGQTAFYLAVKFNNRDAAQELFRRKASVNSQLESGWTALHVAVDKGNESMVRILLSHGVDMTLENKVGQTALALAQAQGKQKIVDILSSPSQISDYLEPEKSFVTRGVSGGTMAANTVAAATRASESWFDNLNRFRRPFYNQAGQDGHTRIRIAIIDSGIDPEHVHMGKVHGYRDFINNSEVKQDTTGHGSTGIDLICKVIEDPEIYVARVFEREEGSIGEQEYTARAIEHARDVWKVNIIALASGFDTAHRKMEQEISKCITQNILIFAAAGNEANVGFIKFPANLESVICMFATDAMGKAITSSINPSPHRKSFYNFAIFGEGVVSRPGAKPQSGTSMATFLGAAVAGLLLDICQLPDVKQIIGKDLLVDLQKARGMSAVLEKMAGGGHEGYECISPWKICSSFPRPPHEERKSIASTIMVALDSIWK